MCNIAGYVGERAAAPILIEMMRREEGFDAGFYTGIATIDNGRIHYRKVTGDLDTLLKKTDAASLPGSIGIIHSRTKSGGPDEWSHPFVSSGKYSDEPTLAYVANGYSGMFRDRDPEYNLLAEGLLSEGYRMDSEIEMPDGIYNRLSNGKMVHMSDLMCALIAKEADMGKEPADAMTGAFTAMPGELVGLLLSLKTPDAIVWSKVNRPMALAYASHGAYLATSAIAHPDDAGDPIELPYLSSGYVRRDGFTATRYPDFPAPVVSASPTKIHGIYEAVTAALAEERAFTELYPPIAPFFPDKTEVCIRANTAAIYSVLHSLNVEGRLEITKHTVPGEIEGTTAPLFKFRLK